jgi:protein tyrosine phosphatase (PTP) superfamily phosphohydrolase (DUF442 family)
LSLSESMEKRKIKFSRRIQSIFVIILILSGAGYYYFHFIVNSNFREVVAGKVYRSAQPSGTNLREWVNKYGIKTVVDLRADKVKNIEKEKLAAEKLGMKFIGINLSGNRLVSCPELLKLVEALETVQTPVLLHCKSGIDRAGFASALAAVAIGHMDFDAAKWQAYVPPGPWKRKDFSKVRADYVYDYAHISDSLKLYEDNCSQENLDKNDWQQFMLWALELPPEEDLDIDYNSAYCYFPFLSSNKHFFQVYKLLKGAYIQFSVEILIVVLLIYYTKFCLRAAEGR